jgi:uncharacterized protein (TIGR02246 family)
MGQVRWILFVMTVLMILSCAERAEDRPTETARADLSGTAEDERAIGQIYDNWYTAWEKKDYKLAAQDYTDDAIWVNAFGMKQVGRANIEKTLERVFGMDFVMAGESKTVEKTVRFIKPDVAVVSSRVERAGQETPSGEKMKARQTSHLRVFVKSGGKWRIVNHLISDARDRENPEL